MLELLAQQPLPLLRGRYQLAATVMAPAVGLFSRASGCPASAGTGLEPALGFIRPAAPAMPGDKPGGGVLTNSAEFSAS